MNEPKNLLQDMQDDGYNEARDRELQRSVSSSRYLEKISSMIKHEQYAEAMQHLDKLLKALKRPLNAFKNDPTREFASLDYILPLTIQRLTECIYLCASSCEDDPSIFGMENLFDKTTKKADEKVEEKQPDKARDERFLNIIHVIENILETKGINSEYEDARFYSMVIAEISEKLMKLGAADSIPNCERNTKVFIQRQFKDQLRAAKIWKLIA